MSDGQDYLRNQIRDFIERFGSTQKFFCKKLGLKQGTHFSLWLKGKRTLSDEKVNILKEILNQTRI